MNVQVEQTSPTRRKLAIEVPAEEVERETERSYRELAQAVQLKGFRPGKAPRSLLQELYGEQVDEEVAGKVIQESFIAALEKEALKPVAEPVIEDRELRDDRSLAYTALIEVLPEIALAEYKGIEVPAEPVEVADDEIGEEIDRLRTARAELSDREGADTAARRGDVVVCDVEVRDGEELLSDLSREGTSIEVDPARTLPELAEGLEGARPGDAREIDVTLPEQPGSNLSGRTVRFAVTVSKVQERVLPAVDDDFAKGLAEDIEGLDDLKAKIREQIHSMREGEAKSRQHQVLVDKLVDAHDFEPPEGLVEQEARSIVRMTHTHDPATESEEDHEARMAEARAQAKRKVSASLLLERIAETEKIEASEEDLDAHIEARAGMLGQDPKVLKAAYRRKDMLDGLRAELVRSKTLDFLLENARILGS